MTLFPDEKIILESDTKEVILTSHRIWQQVSGFSSAETKDIMLEHINSCHSYRKSNIIVMMLALFIGIVCTVGLVLGGTTEKFLSLIFIVFITSYYVWSKKHKIEITSASVTIILDADGMAKKAREQFIDKLENAKHKRLLMLAK